MEDTSISKKTAIAVHATTVSRLKMHMRYGDTMEAFINRLIDFYEKNTIKEDLDGR